MILPHTMREAQIIAVREQQWYWRSPFALNCDPLLLLEFLRIKVNASFDSYGPLIHLDTNQTIALIRHSRAL